MTASFEGIPEGAVTSENCKKKQKVIRGTDWKWGPQDEDDNGLPGTGVIDRCRTKKQWVKVKWNGYRKKYSYRMGAEEAFDLFYGSNGSNK